MPQVAVPIGVPSPVLGPRAHQSKPHAATMHSSREKCSVCIAFTVVVHRQSHSQSDRNWL
ncbi:hypothetical protein BDV40DRAFT_259516, partial [Aspergillus tamarii]